MIFLNIWSGFESKHPITYVILMMKFLITLLYKNMAIRNEKWWYSGFNLLFHKNTSKNIFIIIMIILISIWLRFESENPFTNVILMINFWQPCWTRIWLSQVKCEKLVVSIYYLMRIILFNISYYHVDELEKPLIKVWIRQSIHWWYLMIKFLMTLLNKNTVNSWKM